MVSTVCVVQVLWNGPRFLEERKLLKDDAQPEQADRVITPETIVEENALVLDNHRITISYWVLVWAPHTLMHQHLNFQKICAQWVPHQLTDEQYSTRMVLSLSHLQHYHEEEYGFLSQIDTGDETWRV
ncbi:histone-lysine N-methyltransferase SETMAR [Trichonephila clavipes]|nr:histone-lysine N-methyltransferase SETMAR [Trichonephila clavipes]